MVYVLLTRTVRTFEFVTTYHDHSLYRMPNVIKMKILYSDITWPHFNIVGGLSWVVMSLVTGQTKVEWYWWSFPNSIDTGISVLAFQEGLSNWLRNLFIILWAEIWKYFKNLGIPNVPAFDTEKRGPSGVVSSINLCKLTYCKFCRLHGQFPGRWDLLYSGQKAQHIFLAHV